MVFALFFVLSFVAIGCWSFANPLVAAPDEQAHVIRAFALDHGQMGSNSTKSDKVLVTVRVPASINEVKYSMTCWQFHALVPASCSPAWTTSQRPVWTTTHVGHYPPLYYALVGTGSLVDHQRGAIYAMRLASAAIAAAMLALSAYVVARWSRRRSLAAGIFVALTPITLFLSGSVNPSGFEIVVAICLWTAVTVLALDQRDDPPKALVAIIALAASVLVLIRGLSPLWVALVALALIGLLGAPRVVSLVQARRDVRWAAAIVTTATFVAIAWIVSQGTLNVLASHVVLDPDTSFASILRIVGAHGYQWLKESVGVLGWLDTPLPKALYLAWYALIAGVVALGLVVAGWRQRTVLAAICLLSFVVPVLLVSEKARVNGIVWQGRDGMPLSVGALVLGAALWTRSVGPQLIQRVVTTAVVGVTTVLGMIAFYVNLRRYAVGVDGPHLFFVHDTGWSPPTGQMLTLVLYGVVTTLIAALVVAWVWSGSREATATTRRVEYSAPQSTIRILDHPRPEV